MTEVAAYVAGLLDGEGCMTTYRSKGLPYPYVVLVNTNRPAVLFVRRHFGGLLRVPQVRSGRRVIYRLDWSGNALWPLLSAVEPFLIVKREEANILMDMLEHIEAVRCGPRRGLALSRKDRARRERWARRLKELKQS